MVAPTLAAISISLLAMLSSTSLVMPGIPSSFDFTPAFITPPFTRFASSQWSKKGRPSLAASTSPALSITGSITDLPSSLMATIPAFFIPSISERTFPSCPIVTVPLGSTFMAASFFIASS